MLYGLKNLKIQYIHHAEEREVNIKNIVVFLYIFILYVRVPHLPPDIYQSVLMNNNHFQGGV